MKKLLILLLMISSFSYGQSTWGNLAGGGTTVIGVTTPPPTPPAGGDDSVYCNTNETTTLSGNLDKHAQQIKTCVMTLQSRTPSPNGSVTVLAGNATDLQSKLTNATCGQTIIIPAKNGGSQATYTGVFTYPALICDSSHWVTIQTSAITSIPAEGNRITPGYVNISSLPGRPSFAVPGTLDYYLPMLISNQNNKAALTISPGASHVRIIGLEITDLSSLANGNDMLVSDGADHIIWDRILVHPGQNTTDYQSGLTCTIPVTGTCTHHNAFSVQGTYQAVINSSCYDMHADGNANGSPSVTGAVESYCIHWGTGNNNQGPIKVVNNFFEAAGENIFTGGGPGTTVPVDAEIRRNFLWKPLSWKSNDASYIGKSYKVKNLVEFKNQDGALYEGNDAENTWFGQADQDGSMLLLTPKNANNTCNVCVVSNITVRYNKWVWGNKGMQIAPVTASQCPSGQLCLPVGVFNISIHDNLFDYLNGPTAGTSNPVGGCCGYAVAAKVLTDVSTLYNVDVFHNTFIQTVDAGTNTSVLSTAFLAVTVPGANSALTGTTLDNFTFTDNIGMGGFKGFGTGSPLFLGECINSTGASYTTLGEALGTGCFTWTPAANGWYVDGNVFNTAEYTGLRPNTPFPNPVGNLTSHPSPRFDLPLVGNYSASNWAQYQFANFNNGHGGDYHLSGLSPYKGKATDGKDPGADIDLINNYLVNPGGVIPLNNITVNPPTLTFSYTIGGSLPGSQNVSVDATKAALTYTLLATTSTGGPWLSASGAGLTPRTTAVSVDTTGLLAGTYNGQVSFSSTAANNSPVLVPVTLTVVNGSGNLWTTFTSPTATRLKDVSVKSNGHVFTADRTNGFYKYDGATWTNITGTISLTNQTPWTIRPVPATGTLIACTVPAPNLGLKVKCYRSVDEGTNWTALTTINSLWSITVNPLAIMDDGNLEIAGFYTGGTTPPVWRSTDDGVTWSATTPSPTYTSGYDTPACYAGICWAGSEAAGIYRSTDSGVNWAGVYNNNSNVTGNDRHIAFDVDGIPVILNSGSGRIIKATDLTGSLFNVVTYPHITERVMISSPVNHFMYLQDDSSIMKRSTDGGLTWSSWNTGLPSVGTGGSNSVQNMFISPVDHKIYAATDGTQLYVTTASVEDVIDVLDWALMPAPDRSNFHLSGSALKYFFRFPGADRYWWIKGATGNPWDINAVDNSWIYFWITEDGDSADNAACVAAGYASCFVDPFAYKRFLTKVPLIPRYFTKNTTITTDTAGPNNIKRTTNCEVDNQALIPIGNIRGVLSGPFSDINFGGTIGTTPYIRIDYYYGGSFGTPYTGGHRERFWLVQGYGQAQWDVGTWNGGTLVYDVTQTSTNATKSSGGISSGNFGCSSQGTTAGWW